MFLKNLRLFLALKKLLRKTGLTVLIYTVVFALPNNQDVFIKILQNFAKTKKIATTFDGETTDE